MIKIILTAAACLFLSSCVSTKKFDSMKAEAMRAQSELTNAQTSNRDLAARLDKLTYECTTLKGDTTHLSAQCRSLKAECAGLKANYGALGIRYEKLLTDGSAEAARMLRQLESSQAELDLRSSRVSELEQLLKAREESIAAIRRKVADALLGFEGKGLTVTQRNGMVYVSMDDKLLFKSGSYQIDPNGARAVKELATVLAQNPDISVMVEGHTDDVPYPSTGQLTDNLDLSVKRATTVMRLLLENKGIAPARVIASGRGEYLPVAEGKTPEARAKNRRTEIILTPKIDELLRLAQ